MVGVVKLVELDDRGVPPEAALYQSIVSPAPADADISTVPEPHLDPLTGFAGAEGNGITITVIE
jgi:hypothetical protein